MLRQARAVLGYLRIERRRTRFLLSRLLWRSGLCRLIYLQIPFPEGFRIRFHPSSLSARYWIDRNHARQDRDIFVSYLRPGDVVVDVGANIGVLTVLAGVRVGPSGKVVALEPHKRIFAYLMENVAINALHWVESRPVAVGDASGSLSLTDLRSDDFNAVVVGGTVGSSAVLAATVARLDDLVGPHSCVDLLKVDVEGYELFVFRGGMSVLSRTACVYFEISESHTARYGYEPRAVIDLLQSCGFGIYRVNDGRLAPLTAGRPVGRWCENLVAIRSVSDFCSRTGYSPPRSNDG